MIVHRGGEAVVQLYFSRTHTETASFFPVTIEKNIFFIMIFAAILEGLTNNPDIF